MVNGLEKEIGERGRVVHINAKDRESPLAKQLDLKLTPTFVLLGADGRELWRTVGKPPDKSIVLNLIAHAGRTG